MFLNCAEPLSIMAAEPQSIRVVEPLSIRAAVPLSIMVAEPRSIRVAEPLSIRAAEYQGRRVAVLKYQRKKPSIFVLDLGSCIYFNGQELRCLLRSGRARQEKADVGTNKQLQT